MRNRWMTATTLAASIGGVALALLAPQEQPVFAAQAAPVTFSRDVLPLLQKHCQACHRPGEIAPMSFLTYESTRPWAQAIKTAVLSRKMPPWFADPQHGRFSNDRSLKPEEIDTLVRWVDGGAVPGQLADGPPPVQWPEGWQIRPDYVVEVPPYTIPADGTVEWAFIVIPTGFTETLGSRRSRFARAIARPFTMPWRASSPIPPTRPATCSSGTRSRGMAKASRCR